ncbi:hypothetical protein LTR37_007734 [Vermiconidia calcicola]|uniref:Uncharacterized protein n=1 Tax=Vermiconidia calcicola TaxID=1690605 RepID=A0ACC3NE55_9PEZI|nr:hypothetical protein LTR37_007734 [Vermiconidia calcicola]
MRLPVQVTGFAALTSLLSVFITSVTAYADPLPCEGTCTNTHDPSLIQRASDGTYFRFATGGGMSIHTAPSIQGPWTFVGEVLENGSSIDNSGADDAWAPDVHLVGDMYHVYYSVSTFGTQESVIGVATSESMDPGTWTDHGSIGLSSTEGDDYNAIDANLFQSEDVDYMSFGSFWGDLFQTTMNGDALTVTGDAPYQIELNDTGTRPSEAAYIFQHDENYYLFFSSGICCGYSDTMPAPGEEYKIMVCRSETVTGGYVDADGTSCLEKGGTQVLGSHGTVYGPGGQGVYDDPSLGPVVYYHYVDTTIGYADGDKRLGVNVLNWSDDGWPSV